MKWKRSAFAAAVLACILLAGCFNGMRDIVNGEKLGPGRCRHPGVVELQILEVKGPPNATINVTVKSLLADKEFLMGFTFRVGKEVRGVEGHEGVGAWRNFDATVPIPPGGQAYYLGDIEIFPESPWERSGFSYGYRQASNPRNQHPTDFYCSLEGDNAPEAFMNQTEPL